MAPGKRKKNPVDPKDARPKRSKSDETHKTTTNTKLTSTSPNSDIPEITHWLMKAEPDSRIVKGKDVKFSIDDFAAISVAHWDGVRNHEAKNIMKEKMKIGHKILFYHSNTKVPGVAGIGEVVKEAYTDYTAFDPSHPYYDPKSDKDNPRWYMVDVKYIAHLKEFVSLKSIQKYDGEELKNMMLIRRGRLSVQPVSKEEYEMVVKLGGGPR